MDSLQFEKAEFSDPRPKCGACRSVIEGTYFHLAGVVICPTCAGKVQHLQAKPNAILRGLLFGAGAAIGSAIVYAVIIVVTGFELALISIAVGYVVGKAVRRGAGGGGRACQIIAVALTYLAITISYTAFIFKEPNVSVLGVIFSAGFIVVSYLYLQTQDGISGILSIAILAFGMLQAWRQTGADQRVLSGPYSLEVGTAGG